MTFYTSLRNLTQHQLNTTTQEKKKTLKLCSTFDKIVVRPTTYFDLLPPLQQTKQKWTAAPAPRTRSSTTCWSSCSRATVRWRSESPAPSASTTTSSWSSSADTPPASTAAQRSRPARSAGRPSASGSSCLSERGRALSSLRPKEEVEGWG